MALLMISPLVLGSSSAPKGFPATSTGISKLSLQAPTPTTGFTSPATVTTHMTMKKKKLFGVRMSLRYVEPDIINAEEALYAWILVPGVTSLKYVERVFVKDAIMISARTAAFQPRALKGSLVEFISYLSRIELKDPGRFNFRQMTMALEGEELKVTIPKNIALLG